MITLCQFSTEPVWGVNPSPYCMKVEAYLRLTGIPFHIQAVRPDQAPRGKLPFIIEEDGRQIPDSTEIIAHLEATRGAKLDGGLSAEQKALAHLIRRLCEESLFLPGLYGRWIEEEGWRILKPTMFRRLPAPLKWIIPWVIRRGVRNRMLGPRVLRLGGKALYEQGCADLEALAGLLGDRAFFLGTEGPSSADITVYAFVANILKPPFENPLKACALRLQPLVEHTARMDALATMPR